jgi:hypothetical protein
VDSPLPQLLPGYPTLHLYSAPSAVRSGALGAFFGCTSTGTAPVQVGVEVFGPAGGGPINDAVATSLSVAPGARVIFDSSVATISISSELGSGPFSKGSARILATSKNVVWVNDPPQTSWQLTIIAKTKQKAAN